MPLMMLKQKDAEALLEEAVKYKYEQKFQMALQKTTQCIEQFPNYFNGMLVILHPIRAVSSAICSAKLTFGYVDKNVNYEKKGYFQRALILQEGKKVNDSCRDFFKSMEILEDIARGSLTRQDDETRHIATAWIYIVKGWIHFSEHSRSKLHLVKLESQLEEFKSWAKECGILEELMAEQVVLIPEDAMLIDDNFSDASESGEEDEYMLQSPPTPTEIDGGFRIDELESELEKLDELEKERRQILQENKDRMQSFLQKINEKNKIVKEMVRCTRVCFEWAVNIAPELSYAHFSLGYILERERQFTASITSFERALDNNPDYSRCSVFNNIAWCWTELGDNDKAMQYYRLAINEYNHFVRAYLNMARLYRNMGQFQQAEQTFFKVMYINRTHVFTYLELGDMFMFDARDEIKAMQLFNGCKRLLDTSESYPYTILAMVAAFRYRDYPMAVKELSAGIDWCKDPMNLKRMLQKRAQFYRAMGNTSAAERDERDGRMFVESRHKQEFKCRLASVQKRNSAFQDVDIIINSN